MLKSSEDILNKIDVWISEGSGWTIKSVDQHLIYFAKYKPLKGSSYVELLKELQHSRKGFINIQNKDNECFRWCRIRHLNPQDKHQERSDKEIVSKLDYTNVQFPVSIKDYNKVEKQSNINVNVFCYENKTPFPIYVSREKHENVLNLLLIKDHYVLINNFNRFMYNYSKHKEKKHFCMYCPQCFCSGNILEKHKNCLIVNDKQVVNMPNKGEKVQFENYHKQLEVPFVIYADSEAIVEKIHGLKNNPDTTSYTDAYQKHKDCSYAYKVVYCYDDQYSKPLGLYRGPDVVYKFIERMLEEEKWCKKTLKKHFNSIAANQLEITEEEEMEFKQSDTCHLCDVKVRDHCHIIGKYRGSDQHKCNINYKLTEKIPVIFHNLHGYDSHFIMQEIGKFNRNINVILNNMERYMSFMLGERLVLLDSFQMVSSNLERLVSNLPEDLLRYTTKEFNEQELKLMKQKGVYPYDYMDSFQKFKETELPVKEEFYSILNDKHITDNAYEHAKNVWTTFKMQNLGEYHDLYLKSDILLLADVFENFRKTCMQYYKLDLCHYFTSPGPAWDAMLKMTGIKSELMDDVDMYQFVEKGMRGGISYIVNRYGSGNNKYIIIIIIIIIQYDSNKADKYIMYLDANNLYGWVMSQSLPIGGFKWKEPENVDLNKCHKNSDKGILLEVDLDYPEELHNIRNDYALAPEKRAINKEELSAYCKRNGKIYNISSGKVSKLVTILYDKKNYVVHHENIKLYLSLGMKLKKIRWVLEFNQSKWLKRYTDFNTHKRTNNKNAFEKDFFKLMEKQWRTYIREWMLD